MKMSNAWYQLFSSLHTIVQIDLDTNGTVNWSHYGRCTGALLNHPVGIRGYRPWQVCGVTEDAMEHMIATRDKKGIERGHIVSQLDLAWFLLSPKMLHDKSIFEQAIAAYDVTVLMKKELNNKMTKVPGLSFPYIDVEQLLKDHPEELFGSTYRSFKFRKRKELILLKELSGQDITQRIISSSILRTKFDLDVANMQHVLSAR
jgi:hypothetical protein